jgi:hypothetical protein
MKHGLLDVGSRGIRFFTDFNVNKSVAILPSLTAPTNDFSLRLFNSLPTVPSLFTLDPAGQMGLIPSVNKLDTNEWIDSSSDRLRFTNSSGNQTIDYNRGGTITFYHGGNSNTPLTISTYQRDSSSEYGFNFPLVRVADGRLDFIGDSPLADNKAEIRITGNNTTLGFYNTTNSSFYLKVNPNRTVEFFGDVSTNGNRLARVNELPTISQRWVEIDSLFGAASAGQAIRKNAAGTALEYFTPSTGGGTALAAPIQLTVTATNTLSALPVAPTATGKIMLHVEGVTEFAVGTNPSYTVSGTTVTWNATNAGYNLTTGMKVYALVW